MSIRRKIDIDTWLREFVSAPLERTRDDVHIDEIDPRYGDRAKWLAGGIQCLSTAASSIATHHWPITAAVEFFIEPNQSRDDSPPTRVNELLSRWSHTPPALTVYRRGEEPWKANTAFESTRLEIRELGGGLPKARAYFQEWFDETEQLYDKRLWVVVE